MKIGFFTDTHIRYDTPSGRTDVFRKSILQKLEEVGDIFTSNNVDHIVFGGDLYHTPDPSNSMITQTQKILSTWNKSLFAIIGSHDYFGYQPKTLERTALGIAESAGLLQIIGKEGNHHVILNDSQTNIQVGLIGNSHTYWLAEDAKNLYEPRIVGENQIQIQIVHGDLLSNSAMWQHLLIKDVKTESDIVLSGHYHPGWPVPIKIGNTTFYNPGSIGRIENGARRLPKVCIIEINNMGNFEIKDFFIKYAAEHPFKQIIKTEEGNTMQDITRILSLIETTSVETVDVKAQIQKIGNELQFNKDTITKAFEFLELAETELN